MGKKKKKKLVIKRAPKSFFSKSPSIKITDSGEIKLKKDESIDISGYVKETVTDAVISRLDGITNKEEINIDGENSSYRLDTTTSCSSIIRHVDLMSAIDDVNPQTIVIPMTKKRAAHLDENPIVSWLMKTSTFISVFNRLKDEWDSLNTDDKTTFTNVFYLPKLYIFVDKAGKMRKKPTCINLLIVAFPSMKNATPGIELIDNTTYVNRIIEDTMDAVIKLGIKNMVIDPYCMPALMDDVHYTAKYWYGYTERQRAIENIRMITFTIDNDELFIIFCRSNDRLVDFFK